MSWWGRGWRRIRNRWMARVHESEKIEDDISSRPRNLTSHMQKRHVGHPKPCFQMRRIGLDDLAMGFAEAGEFGGEFAELLLEFGQVIEDRDGFEPIFVVDGRVAGVERAGGDVIGDAALGSDHGAVVNGEMAGDADLTGENAIFADLRGAGEANLAAEQSIFADL